MRVLALGGTGNMGQVAVKTILESKEVERLIVADRDIDRATGFVQSLEDKRVTARSVNIEDTPALEGLMSQADIVMNTVGPFYRFAIPVIRAAIKTGRHYIDIMDDYGPTQEALGLDEEARRVGVTVLIGMGASPGLTNILARHAANQLDEVHDIQTVWGGLGGIRRPRSALPKEGPADIRISAALLHAFYSTSLPIPVFRDGRFVEIIPLVDGEEVTFPHRKGFFRYYGHPEPITLPHFIKGLKGACNLTGMEDEELDAYLEIGVQVRAKELTIEQAAHRFAHELYERRQLRPDVAVNKGARIIDSVHASAAGTRGGKRVRYGYGPLGIPPGGMAGVTGIPLAIGTEMLMEGQVRQCGVLAPEACIAPLAFFERYMRHWQNFPDRVQQYWPNYMKGRWNPPRSVDEALYEVVEEI